VAEAELTAAFEAELAAAAAIRLAYLGSRERCSSCKKKKIVSFKMFLLVCINYLTNEISSGG
jgi:hypothetical protein